MIAALGVSGGGAATGLMAELRAATGDAYGHDASVELAAAVASLNRLAAQRNAEDSELRRLEGLITALKLEPVQPPPSPSPPAVIFGAEENKPRPAVGFEDVWGDDEWELSGGMCGRRIRVLWRGGQRRLQVRAACRFMSL